MYEGPGEEIYILIYKGIMDLFDIIGFIFAAVALWRVLMF
jgi:hypothetical protein